MERGSADDEGDRWDQTEDYGVVDKLCANPSQIKYSFKTLVPVIDSIYSSFQLNAAETFFGFKSEVKTIFPIAESVLGIEIYIPIYFSSSNEHLIVFSNKPD